MKVVVQYEIPIIEELEVQDIPENIHEMIYADADNWEDYQEALVLQVRGILRARHPKHDVYVNSIKDINGNIVKW